MEWVQGESLRQRLDRGRCRWVRSWRPRGSSPALEALHAASIVHRDVIPANLMLVGAQVKLVDFGIVNGSRIARSAMVPRVTRPGMHVGTAGYMAPAQARGKPEVTGAADMFALGCVLYEYLQAYRRFAGGA